jgi:hypothetical protein
MRDARSQAVPGCGGTAEEVAQDDPQGKGEAVTCPRCADSVKDWQGGDAECAFASGAFLPNNWNCATMNALRALVPPEVGPDETRAAVWAADSWIATLRTPDYHDGRGGSLLILGWYKSRGRTEMAMLYPVHGRTDAAFWGPLTLTEAERILAAAKP